MSPHDAALMAKLNHVQFASISTPFLEFSHSTSTTGSSSPFIDDDDDDDNSDDSINGCKLSTSPPQLASTSLPIITPRSFNSLAFCDKSVTKSSTSSAIRGELYYYLNIPSPLSHLFPSLLSHTWKPEVTFTIERIEGVTLSTLLTDGQLRNEHVEKTLLNLYRLHTYAEHEESVLFYSNQGEKVRSRFEKHGERVYSNVGLSADNHFDNLLRRLEQYEIRNRARPTAVIHGDPVLTNILCEKNSGELKFIDMRGAHGSHLTIAGDAHYDLAKLLQSLLGYDFILADENLSPMVVSHLSKLLRVFWNTVRSLYVDIDVNDVVTVCCGLWSSLIPLHDKLKHQLQFACVAKTLLDCLERGSSQHSDVLIECIAENVRNLALPS